jgi:hypothetical protein
MTEAAKNRLGECIDSLDSLYHALALPVPATFHLEMLKGAIPKLVEQMQGAYVESFGENPWETHPPGRHISGKGRAS